MRLAAAAGRRAAAPVEEDYLNTVFARQAGQLGLGAIDAPVRHQVTAVLRAVAEAENYRLPFAAALQVFAVRRQRIELSHYERSLLQVGDGLEKRHDVDRQLIRPPAGEDEERVNLHHVRGALALADDVAVARGFAVLPLDRFDIGDRPQRVANE